MIAAHPTVYNDVQFRSRLEARWAAFFDILGWRWAYEPTELDGWIPDFEIYGAANTILCEVKPIDWNYEAGPEQILQERDLEKALRNRRMVHDCERIGPEILILGKGPQLVGSDWVLGAFAEETWGAAPDWAVIGASPDGGLDFYARSGAFAYRIGGEWDGDHHLEPINDNTARKAWNMAGNKTQRKPPAGPFIGLVGPLLRRVAKQSGKGEE